jgi:hypothetical protein
MALNVQTEENRWNADNAYVTGVDELEFSPRLDDSTQFSTVFAGERPVATLARRQASAFGRGPVWTLYATDGALVRVWHFAPSYRALARATKLALIRASVIRSEAR